MFDPNDPFFIDFKSFDPYISKNMIHATKTFDCTAYTRIGCVWFMAFA